MIRTERIARIQRRILESLDFATSIHRAVTIGVIHGNADTLALRMQTLLARYRRLQNA